MRYYVTGASGFIGKHLVKYLVGKGHEVISITNAVNVFDIDTPFEFIHLSAYGNHYHQKDIDQLLSANLNDLSTYSKMAYKGNCIKFYNISTSSIQLNHKTMYSLSKELGEHVVNSFNDPRFVNVRPYSVYGPGEASHRFIPTVIRALNEGATIPLDPDATHDWIFVHDFIEAMLNGETMIGSGECYRNEEIVENLVCISGKPLSWFESRLRGYDSKNWVSPNSVPHISIFEGLKRTYEYFTQKNYGHKQEA